MTEHKDNNNDNEKVVQDDYSSVKHSVRRKQKERKLRKKRKKISKIKSFLRFLVVVLLIFVSYRLFICSKWYLPQDTFKQPTKQRVELINNKIIPNKVLYESMKDIKVSKYPIFLMRTNGIQNVLYKNPMIKKVYIRRYGFPARLKIVLIEREPKILIKRDLSSVPLAFYTKDEVFVLYKSYMHLPKSEDNLIILTNSPNLRKDLPIAKVRELQQISDDVEKYSNEKTEYIDLRNPNDVYIKIKTTSLRLGVLDSTVFERIKRIYTILPQIKDVDSQVKYIDLSWDKVNYLKLDKADKDSDKDKGKDKNE